MKCEKCGTEYEGNYCPQGCNAPIPAKKKKSIFKKWWFWTIIALVLIVVVAGGSGSDEPVSDEGGAQTEAVSGNETGEKGSEDKGNVYNVGDTVNANGLKILYVSAEKWEGYNEYSAPSEGNMVVRIKISAENTASSDRYISSLDFECYADGTKVEDYYYADIFTGGELSKGRKAEGYLYFEVPVNAKDIEVEYETSFWTDKKAIFKVVL